MRTNTEKYLNLGVDIIIYCGIVTHMQCAFNPEHVCESEDLSLLPLVA